MRRFLFAVGTRPEAIKVIPVYLKFKERPELEAILINSGQHDSMIEQVFQVFDIRPDRSFDQVASDGSLNGMLTELIQRFHSVLEETKPNGIFVQGDTASALAGALAAFNNRIPVYHIEAGLRTLDLEHPFPEEGYRQMISRIAKVNFVPTLSALSNLKNEGIVNAAITGNTVIDAINIIQEHVLSRIDSYEQKFIRGHQSIVLVTGHRRENFGKGLKNICDALIKLAEDNGDTDFIYPVHLNPNVSEYVHERLSCYENIRLMNPISYDELVFLMMRSKLIISDSGGIQEEAPTFGVPVLITRKVTERPEAVELGMNYLVGTDPVSIINAFNSISEKRVKVNGENPFGDGKASEFIIEFVLKE